MHESTPWIAATLRSSELFRGVDESALAQLALRSQRVRLAGGETLMRQGDKGDGLYVVLSGRLQSFVGSAYRDVLVGEVGAGETVGEMAVLTSEPRSATVSAVRDTELLKVSGCDFEAFLEQYPQAVLGIVRMIIRRQHRLRTARRPVTPATIAVLPAGDTLPTAQFTEEFSRQLQVFGPVIQLTAEQFEQQFGASADQGPGGGEPGEAVKAWFAAHERSHRFVLFRGSPRSCAWNQWHLRQADLILVVDGGEEESPCGTRPSPLERVPGNRSHPRVELVLLHSAPGGRPTHTARRMERHGASRCHHVRWPSAEDMARLTRIVLDRGIGVVFGGGGARGLAHLGVLKALEEAKLPIDLIGGCSMGALIGAGFSAGWSYEINRRKNRELWLDSGSLWDYSIPVYALVAGRKGTKLVRKLFGDLAIEDLWTNFSCVTSDLTNARLAVHRSGPVWKAVFASGSLPGILPPSIFDGNLHCDGGVLDNVPAEAMRAATSGPILTVDVSVHDELAAPGRTVYPTGGEFLRRKLNPFAKTPQVPGIFTLLYCSAKLNSTHRCNELPCCADVCLRPKVGQYALFDFRAMDAIIQCGYQAMTGQMDLWRDLICSPDSGDQGAPHAARGVRFPAPAR
ncbi:MAG: patatin-like phospholipase family protein [Thermoguttaceae bacterium]|jgi:predicted acylesterase/phospholipase RssA/CRP-like cAMP-binding protein